MKPILSLLTLTWLVCPLPWSHAQWATGATDVARRASDDYVITERGLHHRVWSRISYETNRQGRVWARTNSYTELESGKHYWDGRSWQETREEIQIVTNGAVAFHGPHKVAFAANLNSPVGVEIQTPEGKRLKTRILGLAYYDFKKRANVLIAELKDSTGMLVATNQLLYPDAFTDFRADVRYTYRKGGLEQDVILRERPPVPEAFGFNPDSTRLLVLTEFLDPPVGVQRVSQVRRGWRVATVDKVVDFGDMKIGAGKAFGLGGESERHKGIPVQKHWEVLEGRTFLIEELSFHRATPQLRALPASRQTSLRPAANTLSKMVAQTAASSKRLLAAKRETRPIEMASIAPTDAGFVVDYDLQNACDLTLRGDTTYYVNGTVNLSGTTKIEGGTVVKYAPGAQINIVSVQCLTDRYRPAIFTAKDDDTVGETITASTGVPMGTYANIALNLSWGGNLKYLNIRYAKEAVAWTESASLAHSQIVFCDRGVHAEWGGFTLDNVLMYQVATNIYGSYFNGTVRHLTSDVATKLVDDWDFSYDQSCDGQPTSYLTIINSLTRGVDTSTVVPIWWNSCQNRPANETVFQTVGAGSHYLAENSPYRNAGTADIDATLRAELRKKTTWPPLVFSNATVATDTTLLPQAQRDTDAPDLGYHYDPVDYIPNYLAVTNCTLTIRQGTVLAYYDAMGLWLQSGGAMDCEGTPLTPNRFVDYRTVQEQPVKLGPSPVGSGMPLNPARLTGGTPAPARLRFTQFSRMGRGSYSGYDLYAVSTWSFSSLDVRDCVFQGGNVMLYSDASSGVGPVTLVNNVFERQAFGLTGEPTLSLYNNLFKECPHVSFDVWGGTSVLRDNVFDSGLLDDWFDPPQTHSHNAYINVKDFYGNPARLYPPQATDQVLTNFLYATGPLGTYYQVSTNLLNAGSRTADLAGLYHHTVLTNWVNGLQIKETNSVVDMGFHYVAVTQAGMPVDADGDGIPDYVEDVNGNGDDTDDPTSWLIYNSANGFSSGNGLKVFTPLK